MSLETVIEQNTATLERLIAILQSAAGITAPASPDVKVPRAKKTDIAAATGSLTINPGDAAGTRYYHMPAHNTVYQQNPGDVDCAIPGAVQVSGPTYLAEKAELAKKFPTAATPVAAAVVEAATAPTATIAPTATAPAATVSDGIKFEHVVAKCQALHKQEGNTALAAVLKTYGAAKVPALAADPSKFAEIIASIDAALMGM